MQELELDGDGNLQTGPPHEERITIALLMLWTAVTAALLGYDRASNHPNSDVLGILPQLMAFVSAPLVAFGLSAWVLMLWRWFTEGPRFPSQAGHWLLLLFGLASVLWIVQRSLVLFSLAGLRAGTLFWGVFLLVDLLALILYLLAFVQTRNRWRWLFGLGLCTTLLALFSTSLLGLEVLNFYLRQVLSWAFCLCILALAIADLNEGIRRDSLHWTGVGVVGCYLIYMTVLPFIIRWVQP